MAVEMIDGTIAATEPQRTSRGFSLFDRITIRDRNGGERAFNKVCTAGDITAALRRGGSGRFYLSRHGGQNGIHGVRLDEGTAAYVHFNNIELAFLIGIGAGAFMLFIGLMGWSGFMITPVVIGAVMLVAYLIIRNGRIAAKRAFDADGAKVSSP
jgi:hypothetical protein